MEPGLFHLSMKKKSNLTFVNLPFMGRDPMLTPLKRHLELINLKNQKLRHFNAVRNPPILRIRFKI